MSKLPTTVMASGLGAASVLDASKRRNESRVSHRVPCRVRLSDPDFGHSMALMGQTVNVSAGGLSLRVGQRIPAGTWVEVLMPYVDGEPVCLCGRVAHSRRVLTGTFEIGVNVATEARPG